MNLIIHDLGLVDYRDTWEAMRRFTDARHELTPDELWLVEHPPVFTQGQAGRSEHLIDVGKIPLVQSDRGGQVTYHGPGQLVAYTLVDLRRRSLGIRSFVCQLETCLVQVLKQFGIEGACLVGSPGVYVHGEKIASLGLRVRHGRAYHGIALNVDMDLAPFSRIHPCGLKEMKVVQIKDWVENVSLSDVKLAFIQSFSRQFGYIPLVPENANF